MAKFKLGQLVAVKYGISWEPRVFHREDDEGMWCMDLISQGLSPFPSGCVKPAEEVWPDIFLSVEREIAKALREQRDKYYQQLHWLCDRLQTLGECPPDGRFRNCRLGCVKCWEWALQEAMKEYADGAE